MLKNHIRVFLGGDFAVVLPQNPLAAIGGAHILCCAVASASETRLQVHTAYALQLLISMSITKNPLSFGSGVDNENGLRLKLSFDEDTHTVYGEYSCPTQFQGSREGDIHPGVVCTILDEIMDHINKAMNFDASIGELTVRYLQPAKLAESLYLRGWFVKKNRRTVENRAEIENDIGKIVARGKGKYLENEEE